jgi:hypothetical protein
VAYSQLGARVTGAVSSHAIEAHTADHDHRCALSEAKARLRGALASGLTIRRSWVQVPAAPHRPGLEARTVNRAGVDVTGISPCWMLGNF